MFATERLLIMRRDVFQAIADPTRREIIHMISQKSLTPNAIADNFDISRQAISKHIRILDECGLISIDQQGRERYCKAELKHLREVAQWLEQYRKFYEASWDRLDDYLEKIQSRSKNPKRKKR